MSVNSSSTRALDINTLILRAWNLAGVMDEHEHLSSERSGMSADFLQMIVKSVETMGIMTRFAAFYDLTLTAAEARYDLPATTLDVFGTAMYIEAGQVVAAASGETPLSMITREEWQRLSSKDASGRPTLYYVHREAGTVEVRFWPIPDEAGTVRLQLHKLTADTNDGAKNPDFESYWEPYLAFELASYIRTASGLDPSFVQAKANDKLERCRMYAKQRGNVQASVYHPTAWSRR